MRSEVEKLESRKDYLILIHAATNLVFVALKLCLDKKIKKCKAIEKIQRG